jgi:cytochrome c oxidase subunit 1
VQIFCWIATLWGGKLSVKTPLLFVLGFVAVFVLGGLTGVMVASVPLDLQVHDTYFVVAHLHYVLIGGAVFPLFGAFYYWFPKWTGRLLSERAGRWNFWLLFIGFNLTFFPMHQLGLKGMTRRIYTYLPETGWGNLNLVASIGAAIIGVSVIIFLSNVAWARRRGLAAGDNPWSADTLEWATASPPPSYSFAYPPTVAGRYALWTMRDDTRVVKGLSTECREVLVTTLMDAEPDHRYELPGPSIWPFLLSLAVGETFIVGIFTPWGFPVGAVLSILTLFGWFWSNPKSEGSKAQASPQEKAGLSLKEARVLPLEKGV